jgi:ATP-dependent DNA helicase RecQ
MFEDLIKEPAAWYYTTEGVERYGSVLRYRFGLEGFRPGQLEVIERILDGDDVLCVMPTGYGKSLCYQLPAAVSEGVTVVVSPLVALMKDQVDALRARGFAQATFINSSIPVEEQRRRLAQMRHGEYKLVYLSPERFRSRAFLGALKDVPLSLFVVDEAHCISQWGHDFRPDYLILSDVIAALGRPQVAAFTATATAEVREDIRSQIGISDARELVRGIGRKNLSFRVFPVASEEEKLLWIKHILQAFHRRAAESAESFKTSSRFSQRSPRLRGETMVQSEMKSKGIIYAGRRRECEFVDAFLKSIGVRSEYFHARRTEAEKRTIQERFMDDGHPKAIDVVVATNAFGLGVDKENVRFVIHYTLPGTVEAYYQEAGRAGRDGRKALCALLYSYDDRSLQEWFIETGLVDREGLERLYEAVLDAEDYGKIRIVGVRDLEWKIKLKETKIRVGLGYLETLGFLKRFPDVMTGMRVHEIAPQRRKGREEKLRGSGDCGFGIADCGLNNPKNPKFEIRNPKSRGDQGNMRRRLLQAIADEPLVHLGAFCRAHDFDPRSVVDMLYDLQFEGKVRFEGGARAMLFRIDRRSDELKKLSEEALGFEAFKRSRYAKLEQMLSYAATSDCRSAFIRRYFDDRDEDDCGICDNCRAMKTEGQEADRAPHSPCCDDLMLTKAILLAVAEARFGLGKSTVAGILSGSRAKNILENDLDRLTSYHSFPFLRVQAIGERAKVLVLKGLLDEHKPDDFDYSVLRMTDKGRTFLERSEVEALEIRRRENPELEEDGDVQIFDQLRRWRMRTADKLGTDPYMVLSDRVLKSIAVLRPTDTAQFAMIKGIGEKKLEQYGREVLEILASHPSLRSRTSPSRERPNVFSDEDRSAVRRFLSTQSHKSLKGRFDVGFALDDHTVVKRGKRGYTKTGSMAYQYKYGGEKALVERLADEMAKFLRRHEKYREVEILVAVPSTVKERAYDPVPRLARVLSERIGIPWSPEALVKTRQTRPQKEMENETQKIRNVRGAFRVADQSVVRGKRVLLIDDLYDSGATINECTRMLRGAGAKAVSVLTLTRTTHSM